MAQIIEVNGMTATVETVDTHLRAYLDVEDVLDSMPDPDVHGEKCPDCEHIVFAESAQLQNIWMVLEDNYKGAPKARAAVGTKASIALKRKCQSHWKGTQGIV